MTAGAEIGGEASGSDSDKRSETRKGQERLSLNFGEIARSLRELAQSLKARRVWLLLDEWSSVPLDMQPYLGEFLVRCVTPVQAFTVKIAAIEQQTRFRATIGDGPQSASNSVLTSPPTSTSTTSWSSSRIASGREIFSRPFLQAPDRWSR